MDTDRLEPTQLRTMLRRLYAEQIATDPSPYLRYHAADQAIASKVASFEAYRPFLPTSGKVLDWGCQHGPDAFMIRQHAGDAIEITGADYWRPIVTRFSGERAAFNSSRWIT